MEYSNCPSLIKIIEKHGGGFSRNAEEDAEGIKGKSFLPRCRLELTDFKVNGHSMIIRRIEMAFRLE